MQFQALSTSYGASIPRDQFIIQALSSRDPEEQERRDAEEDRRLRARERKQKREKRKRRASVLSSYISADEEHLSPTEEEADEEALDDESDAATDDELERGSGVSGLPEREAGTSGSAAAGLQDAHLLSPKQSTAASHRRFSATSSRKRPSAPPTEGTPLLAGRRASIASLTPKPLQQAIKSPTISATRKEALILLWYTIPIFLTHLLEYSLLLATVISVGHIGTAELAASSLGSMTTNVCALSVIQGLCAALDTLCSQAYSSPTPKNTSLYALRTAVITAVVLVPAIITVCKAEVILLALRQDPEVARLAGQYLQILAFGIPGYAGFEIIRRWLQAQGMMMVPTVSLLIASPVNIFLNWLLVWGPDKVRIGFLGAPLSTAISFNIMFIICLLYCIFLAPRDAWGGFSWAIFQDLRPNIVLGLAGFASIASEWWAWEVVGIASAYIGTADLGANSVLATSASLLYQLPYGISVAASVRVGNLVGAGLPYAAKTAANVAWIASVIFGALNSSLLIVAKSHWGKLFSSDEEVVRIVAKVIPLVGVFQLTDGITGIAMGVLRGSGLASLGAQINLCAYWVIGLPLGMALTFSRLNWGLLGLWTGLTVALTFTAAASTWVIYRIDWQEVVRNSKVRADATDIQSSIVVNKDNPAQQV